MKRIFMLLSAFLLILGLSACGPQLQEGKIIEKKYDDADDWSTTSMQCFSRDAKTGVCTFQMPVTDHYHDPEHFIFLLEAEVEGKIVRDDLEVPETDWNRCDRGDHYPDCEPR